MSCQRVIFPVCLSLALATGAHAAAQSEEEDSVYKWGRWNILAPAAGGQEAAGPGPVTRVDDLGPGESEQLTGGIQVVADADDGLSEEDAGRDIPEVNPMPEEPEPPQPPQATGPCNAGPCGFTRLENTSNGRGGEQTTLFELVLDETGRLGSYRVNPDGSGEIAFTGFPLSIGSTSFQDASGDFRRIIGNIERDDAGEPAAVIAFWRQTPAGVDNLAVWGVPATPMDIQNLVASQGGAVLYDGILGHGGGAELMLDFGTSAWTGSFTGGAFDFTSNGEIDGAAIRATGFSGDIDAADSFLEGGIVNHGDNVIGRFEVTRGGGNGFSDVFITERKAAILGD